MNETIIDNSKDRVLKIMEKRKKYIHDLCDLINSDDIVKCGVRNINRRFLPWLVKNDIIKKEYSKTVKRSPQTRKERKEARNGTQFFKTITKKTFEYDLLKNTYFDSDRIMFSSYFRNGKEIKLTDENLLNVNSELWTKAKRVLDLIIPHVPTYIEEYYKKELQRICPLNETIICERCGFSNDKCDKSCRECESKL